MEFWGRMGAPLATNVCTIYPKLNFPQQKPLSNDLLPPDQDMSLNPFRKTFPIIELPPPKKMILHSDISLLGAV